MHNPTPSELDELTALARAAAEAVDRVGLDDAPFTPTTLVPPNPD